MNILEVKKYYILIQRKTIEDVAEKQRKTK